jgi:hypothetical protein
MVATGGGEVTLTRELTMSADEFAACLKRTNQETVEMGHELSIHSLDKTET